MILKKRIAFGSKKAIVIGNYTNLEWHSLKGPDIELAEILGDFEVEFTEDYDRFRYDSLRKYDLCVAYTENRLTHGLTRMASAGWCTCRPDISWSHSWSRCTGSLSAEVPCGRQKCFNRHYNFLPAASTAN